MTSLIAACAFFVIIHLFVAGTRLRDVLVGAVGDGPYQGLFALASAAALIWMSWAYAGAKNTAPLWATPEWLPHAGALIVLVAFLFAVIGILTPNPTSVQAEKLLDKGDDAVRGMVRITRHPFLWGVLIWALFHIAANADQASIAFFGALAVVAFFGMMSIDAKRKRKMGEAWTAFAAGTSLVPFAAILTGRTRLKLGEIGLVRPVAALALFAAVFFGHGWLFGAVPF